MFKIHFHKLLPKLTKCLSILALFLTLLISFTGASLMVSAQNGATVGSANNGIAFLQPSGLKCIFYIDPKTTTTAKNPDGCTEKTSLVIIIQEFLIAIAPFVTTVLIIIGGYEYFVDNEAKKTSAKSTIFAAISGYIIIILAPIITKVISETFSDNKKVINSQPIIDLLEKIIAVLIDLSSIVSVVVIVLAGYAFFLQFFVNSGKQEGKMNGRELLTAGVLGLIVTTIARPLVGFIRSTLSADKGNLGINSENIIGLVRNVLANFLIPFASIVTLVFIVASAFMWLTAGSDETKVKNAKTTLNGALIGLVIVLLSTTIVQLIIYFIQPATGFIPGSNSSPTNNILSGPDPLRPNPATLPSANPDAPVIK